MILLENRGQFYGLTTETDASKKAAMNLRSYVSWLTFVIGLAACAAQGQSAVHTSPPLPAVVSVSAAASVAPAPCSNERPNLAARLWCHKILARCELNAITEPILLTLEQHPRRDELELRFVDGTTEVGLATITKAPWVRAISVNLRWVSNVSPLTKLKELRTLHLKGVEADTSLAFLRQMKQIEELEIDGEISDPSPLESLDRLKRLRVSDPAPVMKVISRLSSLTELEISHSSTEEPLDISLLAGAPQLVKLDMAFVDAQSFAPLAALTKLETLRLSFGEISDLTPVGKLTQLRELELSSCRKVNDFTPLQNLSRLETLDANGTRLSDLAALEALPLLKKLDISETSVKTLAPLAKHCVLTELNAAGTQISDLAALSHCASLTDVDVHDTPVTSVAALAKLSMLETVNLLGTGVRDVTPLSKVPTLSLVYVPRLVGAAGIQALKKATPLVQIKETVR